DADLTDELFALRRELTEIGRPAFSAAQAANIQTIVSEVVDELYTGAKRQEMQKMLLDSIQTFHFRHLIPRYLFSTERDFHAHREGLSQLASSMGVANAWGAHNEGLRNVKISAIDSMLILRCTLKHEIAHLLITLGEIK